MNRPRGVACERVDIAELNEEFRVGVGEHLRAGIQSNAGVSGGSVYTRGEWGSV